MKKRTNILAKAGLNGFFFGLLAVVVLAFQFPEWGSANSVLPLSEIAEYGVSVIFFFYGLKLSPDKLKAGLFNWRLHLLIQSSTFILFPIVIILIHSFFGNMGNQLLWIGFFYVAALPSTVSSSVVMVSIAGGNMSAAIFNASISSILGVFVTPIWMALFMNEVHTNIDTTQVIIKLCFQVIAPVVLGLLLHQWFGGIIDRYRNALRLFDQTIILLIVFTSFCESVAGNMFAGFSIAEILLIAIAMLVLFLSMFGLMYLLSVLFKLNREDRIAMLFCGSKKSLVQGAVMGKALFPDPLMLGVVLLPLMLYHALQLIVSGIIAEGLTKRSL
jgi:sodium/bile acid cotransporter 7